MDGYEDQGGEGDYGRILVPWVRELPSDQEKESVQAPDYWQHPVPGKVGRQAIELPDSEQRENPDQDS